jgi:hypothetical protein
MAWKLNIEKYNLNIEINRLINGLVEKLTQIFALSSN